MFNDLSKNMQNLSKLWKFHLTQSAFFEPTAMLRHYSFILSSFLISLSIEITKIQEICSISQQRQYSISIQQGLPNKNRRQCLILTLAYIPWRHRSFDPTTEGSECLDADFYAILLKSQPLITWKQNIDHCIQWKIAKEYKYLIW